MTKFVKELFVDDGEMMMYPGAESGELHFVARFKYRDRDKAGFKSFLIKNFTVEEYFGFRCDGLSPGHVLETKGYVSTFSKKLLKNAGYAPTFEGKTAYLDDVVAKNKAKA